MVIHPAEHRAPRVELPPIGPGHSSGPGPLDSTPLTKAESLELSFFWSVDWFVDRAGSRKGVFLQLQEKKPESNSGLGPILT